MAMYRLNTFTIQIHQTNRNQFSSPTIHYIHFSEPFDSRLLGASHDSCTSTRRRRTILTTPFVARGNRNAIDVTTIKNGDSSRLAGNAPIYDGRRLPANDEEDRHRHMMMTMMMSVTGIDLKQYLIHLRTR